MVLYNSSWKEDDLKKKEERGERGQKMFRRSQPGNLACIKINFNVVQARRMIAARFLHYLMFSMIVIVMIINFIFFLYISSFLGFEV